MAIREELTKQGNWLFRWRSYLPLMLAAIVPLGIGHSGHLGHSSESGTPYEIFCLLTSLLGVGIRFVTIGSTPKGTSGTNTRKQIADRLNTAGMYSIVRHPLYFGNFVIWFGLAAVFGLWWFILIITLVFWIYYERIIFAEEEFLRNKFGDAYLDWSAKTPAFLPHPARWRSSAAAFSIRKAVRNEYKSLFAVIAAFTVLEILTGIIKHQRLELDDMWQCIFIGGLVLYTTIRFLKKRTNLLEYRQKSE